MILTLTQVRNFQKTVYGFFDTNGRDLPWRRTDDPYAILVSEVMLQQTQVSRVIEKYKSWIRRFPSALELSQTTFEEVLPYWTGLGYNRRALYLKKCADEIICNRRGIFPTSVEALMKLPGVGAYTARAICVFSYNQPVPLIETNVRTVFIHHFFEDSHNVSDEDLLPLITQTLDGTNPRRWFNALFDYGAYIKATVGNMSQKSRTYVKQSPLKGSVREVRGWVMKKIAHNELVTLLEVENTFGEVRAKKAIEGLIRDGLLKNFGVEEA